MRVLLDTCVWGGAKASVASAGHDVVWSGDWTEDPGDEEILRRATSDNRVLVTLDKDFGELAIMRGQQHRGIVRLVSVAAKNQGPVCNLVLQNYGQELEQGAIVTVEPGRVRIRSAEEKNTD